MKRSGPPERRTPLKRVAMKPGRKRLRQVSDATVEDRDRRAVVKANVLARDGHRCVLAGWQNRWTREWVSAAAERALGNSPRLASYKVPACGGPLDFGHRRHAGAGGAYVEANGNTLCRVHNGWAEDQPDAARAVGGEIPWWLCVREGDPEWTELGRKAQGVR